MDSVLLLALVSGSVSACCLVSVSAKERAEVLGYLKRWALLLVPVSVLLRLLVWALLSD